MVVAGIDEVGRGCLAGPLVVAGVVMDVAGLRPRARRALAGLNDSKALTAAQRDDAAQAVLRHCDRVVVMSASAATIDRDGLQVTNVRLLRAVVERLGGDVDACVVDGRPLPDPAPAHHALVGGDGRSACVAAASIVAKTTRDRLMRGPADAAHPHYGFARHVGYATRDHRAAITRHGPSPLHRVCFAPVHAAMATAEVNDGPPVSDIEVP